MKIGMIVLAGGIGKRIGRPFPKQFLLLGGKPLIIHVLEKARVIPEIDTVIITCPEAHLAETRKLIANHGFDAARFSCITGGASRQESVYLGLGGLGDCDSVIVHEAVRPLVTAAEFRELIAAEDPNAMFGIPIAFTVLKGPRIRRGSARTRRAGQRPAAAEVRPGEPWSRRMKRPGATAPPSPRTPACSTATPASRSGSCPAPSGTSRSRSRPTS